MVCPVSGASGTAQTTTVPVPGSRGRTSKVPPISRARYSMVCNPIPLPSLPVAFSSPTPSSLIVNLNSPGAAIRSTTTVLALPCLTALTEDIVVMLPERSKVWFQSRAIS